MWIRVRVAGTAITTRITNGTTVQRISTAVLSWKCAGCWPVERRWTIIDQNIAPKTSTPITTQIQKMVMCRSKTDRLTSVAPGAMLTVQAAFAWLIAESKRKPIQTRGCRSIRVPLIVVFIPPAGANGQGVDRQDNEL